MIPCYPDIEPFAVVFGVIPLIILILPFRAGSHGQKVWVTHRGDPAQPGKHQALFIPSSISSDTYSIVKNRYRNIPTCSASRRNRRDDMRRLGGNRARGPEIFN